MQVFEAVLRDFLEIDSLEKGVRLHDLDRLQTGTQSVEGLYLNHSVNKVNGLFAHYLFYFFLGRPLYIPVLDVFVHRHWVCAFEGHRPYEHFKQDAPHCPNIDCATLFATVNHFWRLVIYSSHKCAPPSHVLLLVLVQILVHLPCVPKVNDLQVVERIQHDILRL